MSAHWTHAKIPIPSSLEGVTVENIAVDYGVVLKTHGKKRGRKTRLRRVRERVSNARPTAAHGNTDWRRRRRRRRRLAVAGHGRFYGTRPAHARAHTCWSSWIGCILNTLGRTPNAPHSIRRPLSASRPPPAHRPRSTQNAGARRARRVSRPRRRGGPTGTGLSKCRRRFPRRSRSVTTTVAAPENRANYDGGARSEPYRRPARSTAVRRGTKKIITTKTIVKKKSHLSRRSIITILRIVGEANSSRVFCDPNSVHNSRVRYWLLSYYRHWLCPIPCTCRYSIRTESRQRDLGKCARLGCGGRTPSSRLNWFEDARTPMYGCYLLMEIKW